MRGTKLGLVLVSLIGSGVHALQRDEGLDEVIVTATKRTESLQEAPVAVTAFSTNDLEQMGAFDAVDVARQTPGLVAEHLSAFGSPVFFVRGVGTDSFSIGSDQSVGVYLDGVYIGRNVASIVNLLDMERVEVLKGPQGTLYGRNATGGAINYITRAPGDEFRGNATLRLGDYDRVEASALVAGPLVPGKLTGKIGAQHSELDGYVRNVYDDSQGSDRDSDAVVAQLDYTPTDDLRIRLSADWAEDQTNGTYGSNITRKFDPFGIFGSRQPFPAFSADDREADLECTPSPLHPSSECGETRDMWGVGLDVAWELSDTTTLKSITAYRTYDYFIFNDADGTSLPLDSLYGHENQDQFSQELQLAYASGKWDAVFGAYYFEESDEWPDVYFGVSPFDFFIVAKNETEAYAAFADVRYQATEQLTLAAGVRYSKDEKNFTYGCEDNIFASQFSCPTGSGLVLGLQDSESWSDVTPQFTVSYDWSDDVMTYVKYSQGFKSGAYNAADVDLPAPVDQEELDAWEVGAKTTWADGRLVANLAAFYYDFTGLQLTVLNPATGQALTVSAGEAEIQGFELETFARPVEGLELSFGVAWLDSEFTEFNTLAGDYTGNELPRAPEWTVVGSAQYTHALSGDWDWFAYANYSWTDEVFYTEANSDLAAEDGHTIVTARLGVQNDRWSVNAFAQNLLDEVYYSSSGRTVAGNRVGNSSPPRYWGIEITRRFGAE